MRKRRVVPDLGSTIDSNHLLVKKPHNTSSTSRRRTSYLNQPDIIVPEITQQTIRPTIDSQYGDLLPLPPSHPGSPTPKTVELLALPDSRPQTPENDQYLLRELGENSTNIRRKGKTESPVNSKSHSQSAIPIQFCLGGRQSPGSYPNFWDTDIRSSEPLSLVTTATRVHGGNTKTGLVQEEATTPGTPVTALLENSKVIGSNTQNPEDHHDISIPAKALQESPTLDRCDMSSPPPPQPMSLPTQDADSERSTSPLDECDVPSLNNLSSDGKPFQCPVSCTILPFGGEMTWKRDVFNDVKEVTYHRSRFTCRLCLK